MSLHGITYGDERIQFSIRSLTQARRQVVINVMPDGSVRVDAPAGAAVTEIKQAVRQRAAWVWKRLQAIQARRLHVLPREYVSGETHFYLGRRHLLKVQKTQDGPSRVRLWRGRLEVITHVGDAATVRGLLEGWYRERAADVFAGVIEQMAPRVGIRRDLPPLRLRWMKTQWGSCSPQGVVLLNPQLVKAPKACIEYVVAHELCHLREHNHGERFHRLMNRVLPEWEPLKVELDELAELLLNR